MGKDETFKFHKRIKLADGTPFVSNEKDIICKVCVSKFPEISYLPMSLFEGKKEKEILFFFYDDLPIELTLNQMNHPVKDGQAKFETFVQSLKQVQAYHQNILCKDDVPKDMQILGGLLLTRDAKVFDYHNQNYIPVTEKDVAFFKKALNTWSRFEEIECDDPNTLIFSADGIKDLNDLHILVDRKNLFIAVIPTRTIEFRKMNEQIAKEQKMTIIRPKPPVYRALHLSFNLTFDLTKIKFSIKNVNDLVIELPIPK